MYETSTARPIVLRNANLMRYDDDEGHYKGVGGHVEFDLVNIRDLNFISTSGKKLDAQNAHRAIHTQFTAVEATDYRDWPSIPLSPVTAKTKKFRIPYNKAIHEYLEARKERGNITYFNNYYDNGKLNLRIGDESFDPDERIVHTPEPVAEPSHAVAPTPYQPQNYGDLYSDDSHYAAPGPSAAAASPTGYRVRDSGQFDTALGDVTSQMSNLDFGGSSGQPEAGAPGTQQPYGAGYVSQYGEASGSSARQAPLARVQSYNVFPEGKQAYRVRRDNSTSWDLAPSSDSPNAPIAQPLPWDQQEVTSSQLQATDNDYIGPATSAFTFTSVSQDRYQAPLRKSEDYTTASGRPAHIDHNGVTSFRKVLDKAKHRWSKTKEKAKDWREDSRGKDDRDYVR